MGWTITAFARASSPALSHSSAAKAGSQKKELGARSALCIVTTLHSNDPDAKVHLPHGPHFVHEGGPAVFLRPDASGRRSLEQTHRRRLPGLNETVSGRSFPQEIRR